MQKYNYSKLLGRMKECGYTQEKLAKAIGISDWSVNCSLNNKRDFRQGEMLSICNLLSIPTHQIEEYFFAHIL